VFPETSLPIQTSQLTLRRFEPTDFDAYATYHRRGDVYSSLYASRKIDLGWDRLTRWSICRFFGVAGAASRAMEVVAFQRCKQETTAWDRFEGGLISALRDC